MLKSSSFDIAQVKFCQVSLIVVATFLSLGKTHEVKSSYYLISTQTTERNELTQVNSKLNEEGCISLCNRKDACTGIVYNTQENSGSCRMKLNGKEGVTGKDAEISKEENILRFKKLGRTFDFKERKFRGRPCDKGCGLRDKKNQTKGTPRSCKEIYETNRSVASGVFSVFPDGNNNQKEQVYCYMTNISGCGEGGWTLVMKINGDKAVSTKASHGSREFHRPDGLAFYDSLNHVLEFNSAPSFLFNSHKWTSKAAFNPTFALTGLDQKEAISPAYWTTPLTKLCLGMKKLNEVNWILVSVTPAQTLHNLIAANKFTSTRLGRDTWKSLLKNSYLQQGCDKEGFNAFINDQKVRIGIVAGTNCYGSGSSLIGFGSTTRVTSGNYEGDFQGRIDSFGYILVQ